MGKLWRRGRCGILLCGLAAMLAGLAQGQAIRVREHRISARPDAPVGSLSVSVSPSFVNFMLVQKGVATGSNAINVTTSWGQGFCIWSCTVNLYAYFANGSSALSAGTGGDIPSSAVLGEMPTGTPTTFTAFTQSGPLGGAAASLLLFTQSMVFYTGDSSRTDALNLEINLSGLPQEPAGTYTGTLYIQAQTL